MESPPFPSDVHIMTPFPSSLTDLDTLNDFRKILTEQTPEADGLHDWINDYQLVRFLIARNYELSKSVAMIKDALKWRRARRPHEIESKEGWLEMIAKNTETGRLYIPGHDIYGRPILIFDNTARAVSNNSDEQITFLAWNLEFAIRLMPKNVDKYVIFIHLSKFSIFNSPAIKVSIETMQMLSTAYPERLGHLIAYQPSSFLPTVFNAVKSFIDPKTVSKIHFINGDVSDGSPNDIKMRQIIGNNWKKLTGADQPELSPGCSPGYDHRVYWPTVEARLARLAEGSHTLEDRKSETNPDIQLTKAKE